MIPESISRYLIRTLFLVLLFAPLVPTISYGAGQLSEYEDSVIKSFSLGDDYQLYSSIEKLLLEFPNKAESILYYRDLYRLRDIYGVQRVERTLTKLLLLVQKQETKAISNLMSMALKLELEQLLTPGKKTEADKISASLKPVRRWVLIGPYTRYGQADYTYPFFPEISPYIKKQTRPLKYINLKNATGELDVNRFISARNGIVYGISTIRINRPVKLRIYSDTSYKVFINGKEVCANSPWGTYRRYRVIRLWGTQYITVMMKLFKGDSWRFRAFITDDNNTPVNPQFIPGKISVSDFRYIEVMDYPYSRLMGNLSPSNPAGFFRMGNYFDELDSPESILFYKKAVRLDPNPVLNYFLGSSYIRYNSDGRDSAFYLEGCRILTQLDRAQVDFIPAQHMRFRRLYQRKNYFTAYREGSFYRNKAARNLGFRSDFLQLLFSLGYEKEFREEAIALTRDFPHSNTADLMLGTYYSDRNPLQAEKYLIRALGKEPEEKSILSLVQLLREKGHYQKAVDLIRKYNYQDEFRMELIDLLIENRDYASARKILLKAMVQNESPEYYLKLGNMDYAQTSEPSMHWERLLATNPSYFALADFLSYKKERQLNPPLYEFSLNNISSIIRRWFTAPSPETGTHTLYRGRNYKLHHDGSSRAYFEDLIFTGNREGVDKWGEFQIEPGGILHPVHIRIYRKDGSEIDSHQIEEVNEERYINLSSLQKDTVAHIAYVLDMPVTEPRGSRYFSIPITPIQDYNETVRYFRLTVCAHQDTKVTLYSSKNLPIRREKSTDGAIIHSLTMKNSSPIHRETNSGHRFADLPVYSFSTMGDLKDFVRWYNGLLMGKMEIDPRISDVFNGKNFSKTIELVYAYITHDIDLLKNVLFFPGKALNTAYKRNGSVEDKVILAKALLETNGIKSYIALTYEAGFPETGALVNPNLFSRILLYIPISSGQGRWLDFSNQYYPCGVVSPKVIGSRAVVLVGNDFEIKTISDKSSEKKKAQFHMVLDNKGNAHGTMEFSFSGRAAPVRKHFKDKRDHEDSLFNLIGTILPAFRIDSYKLTNYRDLSKPFHISIKGENYSHVVIGKKGLLITPFFNQSSVLKYSTEKKRSSPLLINSTIDEQEIYTYVLPSQYRAFPYSKNYSTNNKSFGFVRISVEKKKDSPILRAQKTVHIKRIRLEPAEYTNFLEFCLKIKELESTTVFIKQ